MDWMDQISRRLRLRDLRILQATVDAGSMAKAARVLAISQPAISYSIAEMEKGLGVPLLDRTSQGVTATAFGRLLLDRSAVVFNELRLSMSEIQSLADPAVGELRIGTTPPMSAVASATINQLVKSYPRMRFDLINDATDVLLSKIRSRTIELAITRMNNVAAEDDLSVTVLFEDELAVIASKTNRWVSRPAVTLKQLQAEPWVFPPAKGFLMPLIRSAFAAEGVEVPQATVITPSTYALAMMVANGPFLAIHPESMLRIPSEHPQLSALAVKMPSTRGPIGLVALQNRALSPIARLFVATAQAQVKGKPVIQKRSNKAKR
jgi:DNA-binding transcriptional LysR family regulator